MTVAESGAEAIAALDATPGHRHRADGHHDAGHGRLRRRSAPSARSSSFTDLPIIAVTGKVMAGERKRCLDAGANDYVPKPVDHRRAVRRAPALAAAEPARGADGRRRARAGRRRTVAELDGGPSRSPSRAAPSTGCTILVVDDDFRNIFAMTALLERGNADVTVAESGAEAHRGAASATPDIDIVLMDIMMPVMDGYDTIRAIRALERLQGAPDHRRHRQGRGRRAPALPRRRRRTTTSPSRSTPPSSSPPSHRGCPPRDAGAPHERGHDPPSSGRGPAPSARRPSRS